MSDGLAKDSTVHAEKFLVSALTELRAYVKEHAGEPGAWKQRRSVLRRLMLFWTRTFESLIEKSFEEARFQAHLTQGANLLQDSLAVLQDSGDQKLLSTILGCLERDFVVGFKLSYGLSMEALWNRLRPDPIPSSEVLDQIVQMEFLASEFDSLRWKVAMDTANLRSVQDSMARAYAFIRTGNGDAAGLVKEIGDEILTLKSKIDVNTQARRPFFAASFEALRQAVVLHQVFKDEAISLGSNDVAALSFWNFECASKKW